MEKQYDIFFQKIWNLRLKKTMSGQAPVLGRPCDDTQVCKLQQRPTDILKMRKTCHKAGQTWQPHRRELQCSAERHASLTGRQGISVFLMVRFHTPFAVLIAFLKKATQAWESLIYSRAIGHTDKLGLANHSTTVITPIRAKRHANVTSL